MNSDWTDIHYIPLKELNTLYHGKLYLGPYLGTDLDDLEEMKVNVVFSLGFAEPPFSGDGIVNYHYDIGDNTRKETREKMLNVLPEIASKMHDHLMNGDNVFVHCHAGVSRSPTAVLWFLTRINCIDLVTAFKHVRMHRPCIAPNPMFWDILQSDVE